MQLNYKFIHRNIRKLFYASQNELVTKGKKSRTLFRNPYSGIQPIYNF